MQILDNIAGKFQSHIDFFFLMQIPQEKSEMYYFSLAKINH